MSNEALPVEAAPIATLITTPDYDVPFTALRTCDSVTAAQRGLRDYLRSLHAETNVAGRIVKFARVIDTLPEAEDLAQYPAAIVMSAQGGEYSDQAMTVQAAQVEGRSLFITAETNVELIVSVRCDDAEMRRQIACLLEDAFSPVDWASGFRLRLPFYHNVVCDYLVNTLKHVDDAPEDAKRRWRDIDITLTAKLPKIRWAGKQPKLHIETRTEVE